MRSIMLKERLLKVCSTSLDLSCVSLSPTTSVAQSRKHRSNLVNSPVYWDCVYKFVFWLIMSGELPAWQGLYSISFSVITNYYIILKFDKLPLASCMIEECLVECLRRKKYILWPVNLACDLLHVQNHCEQKQQDNVIKEDDTAYSNSQLVNNLV